MMNISRHGTILLCLIPRRLSRTPKTLDPRSLWKVHTKSTHVHAVQEGAKAFVEAVQTFVEELEVHHVCFQIGHAVCEFAECWLQGFEGDG